MNRRRGILYADNHTAGGRTAIAATPHATGLSRSSRARMSPSMTLQSIAALDRIEALAACRQLMNTNLEDALLAALAWQRANQLFISTGAKIVHYAGPHHGGKLHCLTAGAEPPDGNILTFSSDPDRVTCERCVALAAHPTDLYLRDMNGDFSLAHLMSINVDEGWLCEECRISDWQCVEQTLYECQRCDQTFADDSKKCPDCGRFSTFLGHECCHNCGGGPLTATTLMLCDACGDIHSVESPPLECFVHYAGTLGI